MRKSAPRSSWRWNEETYPELVFVPVPEAQVVKNRPIWTSIPTVAPARWNG